MSKKHQPPQWAIRWMEWFARPSEVDEIIGDATEMYYSRAKTSRKAAYWRFVWDIIRYTRISNMRKFERSRGSGKLYGQYLVLGWRSLKKRSMSSAINMFGLSIAVACILVAFAFNVRWILNDRYHEHRDAIHLVTFETPVNDEVLEYGITPVSLGTQIEETIPQVSQVVRVYEQRGTLHANDMIFNQHLRFVDPAFFDMFTYTMKYGKNTLANSRNIVISDRLSEKYFGAIDPVGESVTIYIDSIAFDFTIGGVVDEQDESNSLRFELLIPFENWEQMMRRSPDDWEHLISATFVQIDEPGSVEKVQTALQRFIEPFNHARVAREKSECVAFRLQPIKSIKVAATDINYNYTGSRSMAPMVLLTVIGSLMLLLALINYVNISLDMISRRLKETGIRKVMGSSRRQIMMQFMTENAILCFLSIVLGVVLAVSILIPGFNDLASVHLRLDFVNDDVIWVFLTSLFVCIVVLSGAYPAYHVASYHPVAIFRQHTSGRRNRLTLPFLFMQFALATLTIVAGIMFVVNDDYQKNRGWGYDPSSQLVVQLQPAQYDHMHRMLMASPEIHHVAGAENHTGVYPREYDAEYKDQSFEVNVLAQMSITLQ